MILLPSGVRPDRKLTGRRLFLVFAYFLVVVGMLVGVLAISFEQDPKSVRFLTSPPWHLVLYLLAILAFPTATLVAATDSDPTRWLLQRTFGEFTVARGISTILGLGIVAYVFFRGAFAAFYGRLGIEPEDVGLGYTEVLQLSGVAIAFAALITLAWAIYFGLAVLLTGIYFGLMRRRSAFGSLRGASMRPARRRLLRAIRSIDNAIEELLVPPEIRSHIGALNADIVMQAATSALRRIVVVIALSGLIIAGNTADTFFAYGADQARQVEQGHDAQPLRVYGVTLFPIHAERVTMVFVNGRPNALTDVGRCTYLGQTAGVAILYDVDKARVVRVPSSAVVMSQLEEADRTGCFR